MFDFVIEFVIKKKWEEFDLVTEFVIKKEMKDRLFAH